jgi:hypothetical protein
MTWLAGLIWLETALTLPAATGRVIKVLPEFMDSKGQTTLSPSLYERDAYQAQLRRNPVKLSGMKFFIQWKTKDYAWDAITIRLELRGRAEGNLPKQLIVEKPVQPGGWLSHWTAFAITGNDFATLGQVTAWRATLWEGGQLLGEQKSFLW